MRCGRADTTDGNGTTPKTPSDAATANIRLPPWIASIPAYATFVLTDAYVVVKTYWSLSGSSGVGLYPRAPTVHLGFVEGWGAVIVAVIAMGIALATVQSWGSKIPSLAVAWFRLDQCWILGHVIHVSGEIPRSSPLLLALARSRHSRGLQRPSRTNTGRAASAPTAVVVPITEDRSQQDNQRRTRWLHRLRERRRVTDHILAVIENEHKLLSRNRSASVRVRWKPYHRPRVSQRPHIHPTYWYLPVNECRGELPSRGITQITVPYGYSIE